MKRSTYIMFTLILAGVLFFASLFTVIRCTGEEISNNLITLSDTTCSYNLQNARKLNIELRYTYEDDGEKFLRTVFIREADFSIMPSSSITSPVLEIPDNVAIDVEQKLNEDCLDVVVNCKDNFFIGKEDFSKNLCLYLPLDNEVQSISLDSFYNQKIYVKDIRQENFSISSNDNLKLVVDNDTIGNMIVDGFNNVKVNKSDIAKIELYSNTTTKFKVSSDAAVDSVILGANEDIIYKIEGVNNYIVKPEHNATITVEQKYKAQQ